MKKTIFILLTMMLVALLSHCNYEIEDRSNTAILSYIDRVLRSTSSTPATNASDTAPPTVGAISILNVSSSSITIGWTAATDDFTVQSNIQYLPYFSLSNNLNTVSNIETNGMPVGTFTSNLTQVSVINLVPQTNYYFSVIARDSQGNKAAYLPIAGLTTQDTMPPIPGNSGILSANTVTSTSITVGWVSATDNSTPQSNLQYKVVYSLSNNITTISMAETNGTIAQNWISNLSSFSINGLAMNMPYYITVLAMDTYGNKAIYSVLNVSTLTCSPGPGILSAGYIWYIGCPNVNCNTTCVGRGGVSPGYTFIGTNTGNCQMILDVLGLGSGAVSPQPCAQGAGCYINPGRWLCTSPAFDVNFSSPSDIKACSCAL